MTAVAYRKLKRAKRALEDAYDALTKAMNIEPRRDDRQAIAEIRKDIEAPLTDARKLFDLHT